MENIYHRYLNLPFEIIKHPMFDAEPTEMKHHDINPYRDPLVDEFHKDLGLIINHTEVFWTPAGTSLPVHADYVTLDNHVKINITDLTTANEFSDREHTNVLANRDECTLVYEANTNRPSLVNVGQLHDTYSPPHAGRWTLCFIPGRSNGRDIYWDEAMEIYKDYII